MTGFFITWFVNTLSLLIVIKLMPGIQVDRWETVIIAALVLGLLNAFLRPFIIFLTLPLHIVSLGFFTLLINGFIFYTVSKVIEGFQVLDFGHAFFGALLFSIVSFFLNLFVDSRGKVNIRFYQRRSYGPARDKNIIDVEGKSKDEPGDDKRRIS